MRPFLEYFHQSLQLYCPLSATTSSILCYLRLKMIRMPKTRTFQASNHRKSEWQKNLTRRRSSNFPLDIFKTSYWWNFSSKNNERYCRTSFLATSGVVHVCMPESSARLRFRSSEAKLIFLKKVPHYSSINHSLILKFCGFQRKASIRFYVIGIPCHHIFFDKMIRCFANICLMSGFFLHFSFQT